MAGALGNGNAPKKPLSGSVTMVNTDELPLVTIKCEVLDDGIKEEAAEDGPAVRVAKPLQSHIVAGSGMNNNQSSACNNTSQFTAEKEISAVIKIKEEPSDDPSDKGVTFSTASASLIISTDTVLTIKAEPRDETTVEEGRSVGEVGNDDEDDEDEEDEDSLEFEDDPNDLDFDDDFEMDSSEGADTPDSAQKTSDEDDDEMLGSRAPPRTEAIEINLDLVKTEQDDEDVDVEGGLDAEAADLLASSSDPELRGSFEFNGMKVETIGNYSRCPKCDKNIKSTFIIRHLKLHEAPEEKFKCPEKSCDLVVNRINNLFRHLKVVHKSKKPYMCKVSQIAVWQVMFHKTRYGSHKCALCCSFE